MAEKEQKQIFAEYKENISNQAENLVADHFPKKILELDVLLNSSHFSIISLPAVLRDVNLTPPKKFPKISKKDVPPPSRRRKLSVCNTNLDAEIVNVSKDDMPLNNQIVSMIDQLKPHIQELVDSTNVLKLWILILIPKIEDGNNFGVEIQDETLAIIESIEVEASSYLNKISKYFLDRGDIVTKIADDPYVEDYKRAVMELDEKEFLRIRRMVSDLRNHYTNLHNHITKNLEKIKKPRTSNTENLY